MNKLYGKDPSIEMYEAQKCVNEQLRSALEKCYVHLSLNPTKAHGWNFVLNEAEKALSIRIRLMLDEDAFKEAMKLGTNENFNNPPSFEEAMHWRIGLYEAAKQSNKHPLIVCLACRGDSKMAVTCDHGQSTQNTDHHSSKGERKRLLDYLDSVIQPKTSD